MKTVPGILIGVLFGAAAGGWLAISCAIHDDIVWDQDPHSTGSCVASPRSSYACDVNSDCQGTRLQVTGIVGPGAFHPSGSAEGGCWS